MNEKLGIITKASLNIHERGILMFYIYIDYEDGWSQMIGDIALDEYNNKTKDRIGTAYGCEIIRQLLLCLNVNDFSEMAGKHLFVLGEEHGIQFKALGIRALRDNGGKELIFNNVYKQMIKE